MGKLKLSPGFAGMRGKVGNMVHRQVGNLQIAGALPDFSTRVLSDKQVASNNRFKESGVAWKGLPSAVKNTYKARAKELNSSPCGLHKKNYCQPPSVESIDLSGYTGQAGQSIAVRATDLVEVARIDVTIREAGGNVVESGAATPGIGGSMDWVYLSKTQVPIPAGLTVEAVAANWTGRTGSRLQLLPATP